jgi:hypothetical protein
MKAKHVGLRDETANPTYGLTGLPAAICMPASPVEWRSARHVFGGADNSNLREMQVKMPVDIGLQPIAALSA